MRRRIPDRDLEFYENVIAAAVAIVQSVKALAYWLDDPDTLAIALRILKDAQEIRKTTIQRKNNAKETRK